MSSRFMTVVLVAGYPIVGAAAQWSAGPSVNMLENYDDNPSYIVGPHSGLWLTALRPSLDLQYSTERLSMHNILSGGLNRYSDSSLDRKDINIGLDASWLNQGSRLGLSAAYIRDSAAQTDFTVNGVQGLRQRTAINFAPSFTWIVDERNSIQFGVQSSDVSYASGFSLVDYTNRAASISWAYTLSPKEKISLMPTYTRYETASKNYTSTTYGLQGGWSRIFSETFSVDASAGFRQTNIRTVTPCPDPLLCAVFSLPPFVVDESSGNGLLLSGSMNKQFEMGDLSIALSRSQQPSGSGVLTNQDSLTARAGRRFSEKVNGNLNMTLSRSRSNIASASVDSTYYVIEPSLSWRFSEKWNLGGSYRRSQHSNSGLSASSNFFQLSLTYTETPFSISR